MTDDIKALLAEAEEIHSDDAYGAFTMMHRLADALEAAQFDRPCKCAQVSNSAQTEAARVPATDDEQDVYTTDEYVAAIRSAVVDIADMHPGRGCIGCHWCTHVTMLDGAADVLEGFRRSSRVPVSRDELARAIKADFPSAAAKPFAECVLENFDIYPKADRKPADSGEAGR